MSWIVDDTHTRVSFSAKHMMIATVRGHFERYRGTVRLDTADFTRSAFEGEVDVPSIDTGNAQRDEYLRTSDFLDAPHHPRILFRSTRVDAKGRSAYVVHGELTIRGVTRPVALEVEFHGTSRNPRGQTVARLSARATIRRKDFGVSHNAVLETGGVAVGEKVKIEIDAELIAPEPSAKSG